MIIKCWECGKKFETEYESKRYCSEKCKRKSARKRREHISKEKNENIGKCKECGKRFKKNGGSQKFCSDFCREIHSKKQRRKQKKKQKKELKASIIVTCSYCRRLFETSNPGEKYCSLECRENSKQQQSEMTVVTCLVCNKTFKPSKAEKQYCSPECREKGMLKYEHKCSVCGKVFKSKSSNSKTCSKECLKEHIKRLNKNKNKNSSDAIEFMIRSKVTSIINKSLEQGESFRNSSINYWNIPFNDSIKEKILERDGYECNVCGRKTNLQIHHIVKRSWGGSHTEDNLITLCSKCHRSIETGDIEHATRKCTKNYINVLKNRRDSSRMDLSNKELIIAQSNFIKNIFKRLNEINDNNYDIEEILVSIDNFLSNIEG